MDTSRIELSDPRLVSAQLCPGKNPEAKEVFNAYKCYTALSFLAPHALVVAVTHTPIFNHNILRSFSLWDTLR